MVEGGELLNNCTLEPTYLFIPFFLGTERIDRVPANSATPLRFSLDELGAERIGHVPTSNGSAGSSSAS